VEHESGQQTPTGNGANVVSALRNAVRGEVDDAARRRAEYSSDAGNYRVVPQVVVFPESVADAIVALDVLREEGVPLAARGGGTSIAGNAIQDGAVLDFSRHVNHIRSIDPEAATADVEPGVVMSDLQAAAAPFGLRFGPDPSTQNRATFGGMIGNNACGPHAVAFGRTADNVLELDCVDGRGRRFTAGAGDRTFAAVPGLADLVADNLAVIRTEFGRFGRQVSGYSLEHLLPESGSDLAKALVGTEGTCVTVLGAKLRLVPLPKAPTLVVLGYRDMCEAADDVPALLNVPGAARPLAIEGLDARLIEIIRSQKGSSAVPDLPDGKGWLLIEVAGDSAAEAEAHAEQVVAASAAIDSMILPAGPLATRMWQIRADGAGLAGRTMAGEQAWPGWEDSAVLPENLGSYLRGLLALLDEFGLDGVPYGHFGDGCIHMRVDFPLDFAGGGAPGRHPEDGTFRAFMEAAGDLVVKYGGSMSGEHGDGRARSELLAKMYSPAAIRLLAQFKALFDPDNLLNPGVIVDPEALDANLRRPQAPPIPTTLPFGPDGRARRGRLRGEAKRTGFAGFAFLEDHEDITENVHRCVGTGKCRAGLGGPGQQFMCPSYAATKDEKDVTRGRARVLQEAVNGTLIGGLTSPEVRESLDLCLACKACSADCPAVVDIARLKSEVLYRTYRGKPRPVDHYVLGWLPRWIRFVGRFGPFVPVINAAFKVGPVRKAFLTAGGMDPRRQMAAFASEPFHKWWARNSGAPGSLERAEAVRGLDTRAFGANSTDGSSTDGSAARGLDTRAGGANSTDGSSSSTDGDAARGLDTRAFGANSTDGTSKGADSADGNARRRVVLWTDSFSDGISPSVPKAALRVLDAAGFDVIVPTEPACCGLTWITTGQLDGARKRLGNLLSVLGPFAINDIPIVGLEPSCTAVLRSDLVELFPNDQRALAVAAQTRTVAELLTDAGATSPQGTANGWRIPDLSDLSAVVQPHCHHHSVMGFAADEALLRGAGASIEVLSGCCGLAGNFGMQRGHYDVSVAVAENALLPALRSAAPGTDFLADGFSCRTQAVQLAGVPGKALVEVLAARL